MTLALIGDGASTLPFDLSSDGMINRSMKKEFFQSGARDRFFISPFETIDVGQVRRIDLKLEKRSFDVSHSYFTYKFNVRLMINIHIIVKVLK